MMTTTISFPKHEFNSKCNNLLSNGFVEYTTTIEDGGVTHSTFTNTDVGSEYFGWVLDVYDDGRIEVFKPF